MKPLFYKLRCVSCNTIHTEDESVTECLKCGNQLDVEFDMDFIRTTLNVHTLRHTPISSTKYLGFTPIRDYTKVVSLNEGNTPLHRCDELAKSLKLKNLYIKVEGANPTGVFKDRGTVVEITKAIELGAKAIVVASTGNMAASVSAYAAAAKLPCYVLVPEGAPMGKLAQTLSYGGRVIQIRGTYADCVEMCSDMAKRHNFYLAGDYAIRLEGAKSAAYEIIEQLNWKCPDAIIVPVGCGTNMSAIWKGFKEFFELGFIDKLPRMIGVQPANVPTIVEAWKKKLDKYVYVDKPSTVASAVGIGVPQDYIKALRCLRDSAGCAETATEEEILLAEHALARKESLFTEPSSAIPIAVIPKLLKARLIHSDETIVCIATGTGLKDPKTAISFLPDPPVLEPKRAEIDRYLEMKLYEIKGGFVTNKVIIEELPSISKLQKLLQKEFNVEFGQKEMTEKIHKMINNFLKKGRKITRSDLQNIIESVLNAFSAEKKILKVHDFQLVDSKHDQAHAKLQFSFHDKQYEEQGNGDGPFDAIIIALRKIIKQDGLDVKLDDYSVSIATEGEGAVVKVTITLFDKHNNKAVATATSPDVLVASVDAFEKGYNLLYWKNQK